MPTAGIENSLKERGVRMTRQRRILLDLLDRSGRHLDAESLYKLAKEKDPKLNRVTVYRTLKLLKEGGLIDELDLMHFEGDQHYYESRLKQQHAHVICLRCGKVEEFFGELLQKMRRQVETNLGFRDRERAHRDGRLLSRLPISTRAGLGGSGFGRTERLMAGSTDDRPRAALLVLAPSGQRSRAALDTLPFSIGRQADNDLVLRDNRASRRQAQIVFENGAYVLEDLNSRHGTWVNGERSARRVLRNSDRIDFGVQDSYQLTVSFEKDDIHRLLDQFPSAAHSDGEAGGGDLAKLRSLVEVARALQNSLSTHEVLTAVVDAGLAVTGCERGFLLLRNPRDKDGDLTVSVARDRFGKPLDASDLRVPTSLIRRALASRRDLLSMSFDPNEVTGMRPEMTVATLELRSVVCLPLIQIRGGLGEDTRNVSPMENTVGLLYMDSRDAPADLSAGNRELLQTLAIEASTILENARLLEEERAKIRIEDELKIARDIQQGLQPSSMPTAGWFRAAGSSLPSTQVGGDYFDVHPISPHAWAAVVADVSGKRRQFRAPGQSFAGHVRDDLRRSFAHRAAAYAP